MCIQRELCSDILTCQKDIYRRSENFMTKPRMVSRSLYYGLSDALHVKSNHKPSDVCNHMIGQDRTQLPDLTVPFHSVYGIYLRAEIP